MNEYHEEAKVERVPRTLLGPPTRPHVAWNFVHTITDELNDTQRDGEAHAVMLIGVDYSQDVAMVRRARAPKMRGLDARRDAP